MPAPGAWDRIVEELVTGTERVFHADQPLALHCEQSRPTQGATLDFDARSVLWSLVE